ncbi:MAG: tetratricopeptide repeat protein [Dechloromonas sp.]|nr:tetratricopeptide repeat protein [Dechloromonas sp.]
MTTKSLFQPRFRALRALAFGLSIGFAAPVFADNLPDIQRLIRQGQHAQALEKVDQYLTSRPKDAQGRFLKGLILTEMNRPADAIGVFTKLSEDYPELPEPYNNLAVLYAQQKQYDKARTALEMAIRTHPSYAIAYENLGDVYAKLASQAYDKALQLDGANATTQNKLALIRDLISTSGKGNVRPPAPTPAPTPVAAAIAPQPKPAAPAPTATVVATTPAASSPAPVISEPRPAPAQPAPVQDSARDDVAKAIAAWARAWSRKDMKGYFAAYTSDFTSGKGGRKAWEEERQQRIGDRPGSISVTYDEPRITIDGDRATARFRQHYKAPGLNSSSNKTLVFVRTGGKWLIKEENAR